MAGASWRTGLEHAGEERALSLGAGMDAAAQNRAEHVWRRSSSISVASIFTSRHGIARPLEQAGRAGRERCWPLLPLFSCSSRAASSARLPHMACQEGPSARHAAWGGRHLLKILLRAAYLCPHHPRPRLTLLPWRRIPRAGISPCQLLPMPFPFWAGRPLSRQEEAGWWDLAG